MFRCKPGQNLVHLRPEGRSIGRSIRYVPLNTIAQPGLWEGNSQRGDVKRFVEAQSVSLGKSVLRVNVNLPLTGVRLFGVDLCDANAGRVLQLEPRWKAGDHWHLSHRIVRV